MHIIGLKINICRKKPKEFFKKPCFVECFERKNWSRIFDSSRGPTSIKMSFFLLESFYLTPEFVLFSGS